METIRHETDSSITGLARGVLDDARELFRDEIAPAGAETRVELSRAMSAVHQQVRGALSPRAPHYTAWAALGAIATGAWLVVRGWHACRNTDLYVSLDHPAIDQTYGMSSSGSEGIF